MSQHSGGLFTPQGFTSPEEIRRRIGKITSDQATAFGVQQANLFQDPGRRMAAQIGGAFGAGLAGGFTSRGQVEEEVAASERIQSAQAQRASIYRGIDYNSNESILGAVKNLTDIGDYKGADTIYKRLGKPTETKFAQLGQDRGAYSLELYGTQFEKLESPQQAVVNRKVLENRKGIRASGISKTTGLPTDPKWYRTQYKEESKGINESQVAVNRLQGLLSSRRSGVQSRAIQTAAANLFATSSRSLGEIDAWKSQGNVPQAITAWASQLARGTMGDADYEDMARLIDDFQSRVLSPEQDRFDSEWSDITQDMTDRQQKLILRRTDQVNPISKNSGNIPTAAIEMLRADPALAADFKAKFNVDPQTYLGGL